ncbi:hypothetical protein RND71_037133 [Anisodus tanguticus]|uniref:Pectin acetylesterase n=1 Tax=Anisodus tanguticus TaxID=243964 RepID=A0AAE1R1R2_9SOLA|nr:hypothetical protein RND71_037133 [Anisodus tanguticus]
MLSQLFLPLEQGHYCNCDRSQEMLNTLILGNDFNCSNRGAASKRIKNAKNAILAGSSTEGYPAILYCDRFRNLLPNTPE